MKQTRYLSILTAAMLLTSAAQSCPAAAAPYTVSAAEISAGDETPAAEIVAAGTIDETITWELDAAGTLTITGSGAMEAVPGNVFKDITEDIQSAVIRNTDSKNVITAIGKSLFSGCTNLTSVTLPDTITLIRGRAFANCTALTEITLPDALEKVEVEAFSNTGLTSLTLPGCSLGSSSFNQCTALKTVTIGEGTETIPAECFRACTALESVMLPDSVKTIECGYYAENGAFYNCPQLKTVSIGKDIEKIDYRAFRTTGESLEVTFRKGVTAVPENAFNGRTEVTKVILPDTLTAIGNQAFKDCTSLSECNFPASLEAIGNEAFSSTALTEAALPGCSLGKNAFYACASLKTLTIGEGTETIPAECFRACTALESAVLPDSLKSIECGYYAENGAFYNCPAMKTVSIGKDIEKIDYRAFNTTGTTLEVTFREGVTAIPDNAFNSRTEVTKVVLPDTLTAIGNQAFKDCASLSECSFPASLKAIGAEAFYNTALPEAALPGCSLGKSAFFACTSLKTLTIGEGTETIPAECFRDCTALESAVLPDSVKTIECGYYAENGAFYNCPQLKTVSIGKDIEKIDYRAFNTTGESLEVTFREGVTAIPDNAFHSRTEVTKVILPDTLTTIGVQAFKDCASLSECNFPASLQTIGVEAFCNTALTKLELPGCAFSKGAFQDCASLKTLTIGEGTETIPALCFGGCTALESAVLPDSVNSIECGYYAENGAFYLCPKLQSVSIGKGIEKIDHRAFTTTGESLEVTFREGVTAIPENAFDAGSVTVLVLPQSLTAISEKAVANSPTLKRVVFASTGCEIADSEKTFPADALIRGFEGSTAQAYAEKYERGFQALVLGDVDENNEITADDAQLALMAYINQLATGTSGLSAEKTILANADRNETLTAEDAQYILIYAVRKLAGLNPQWSDIIK